MIRTWKAAGLSVALTLGLTACVGGLQPVASTQTAGKTITLLAAGGKLVSGENPLRVSFEEGGQPAEVQAPSIRFHMPAMATMPAMSAEAPLKPTGEPGVFEGRVDLSMKGTWQTTVTFQDQAGPQQATFNIQAQ
jgi:hypothetical protein